MKLNDEQRQLVEDNHNLIYQYAHDNNLDLEMWYDLLAIELCKSVLKHDPSKGKLSTLFYIRAKHAMWREYCKSKSKKRDGGVIYSLDYEYGDSDGGTVTLGEMLEDEIYDVGDNSIMSILKNEILNSEYGDIIKMRLEGYSQSEIAESMGCSQAHISRILQDIKGEYFD